MFLDPTDPREIITVFMELKNSKAEDAYGFQIIPVKYVIDVISGCLAHIFNACILTAIFPASMQLARVTVTYKKGNRNEFSNYRPISILPVFSKGLEKVILKRLTSFADRFQILTSAQYGIRKHMSTELALLAQKEYILQNFENKNMVLGIFLDFTKAFDLINHDILLLKLEHYGSRGNVLSLISSYLQYRCQFVDINCNHSTIQPVKSGVPQGSILGPFLFILYINEIVNIDESVKYIIYADDTSLFFAGKSGVNLTECANKTLQLINNWAFQNDLQINISKTKAILFRPRHTVFKLLPIRINNTEIETVPSFKTRGVYFTEHMSWDKHVNYIIGKLSGVTGCLRQHCLYFPVSVNVIFYNCLFSSLLSYGALVWGTTTLENLDRLLVVQKRMVRIMSKVHYWSHTGSLFQEHRIINVKSLYRYKLFRYYKSQIIKNTNLLVTLAQLRKTVNTYNTRRPELWKVDTCRTNYGKQMLKFCLPSLLNEFYLVQNVDIFTVSFEDLRNMFS